MHNALYDELMMYTVTCCQSAVTKRWWWWWHFLLCICAFSLATACGRNGETSGHSWTWIGFVRELDWVWWLGPRCFVSLR